MCNHHHSNPVNLASVVEHINLTDAPYFKVPIHIQNTEGNPLIVKEQSRHMDIND